MEIDETQAIHLLNGMIGFPEEKRFVLVRHGEESPFYWFQSVDNGSLAFVLTDPLWFQPDYDIEISPEDAERLELKNLSEGVQILVVVNIHPPNGASEITANLLGPIVINHSKRLAKQIVLYRSPYSHRHPISLLEKKKP
jgi:flagellar assembly factor FliW